MDVGVTLAVLTALPASAVGWASVRWVRARRKTARWARIARAVNLPPSTGTLSGVVDGIEVQVIPVGTVAERTRIELALRGLAFLRIRGRNSGRGPIQSERAIGDPQFDERVLCEGRTEFLLALDAVERAKVAALAVGGWEMDEANLHLETARSPPDVSRALSAGVAVARILKDANERLPERVVEQVRTDGLASIRRAALDALVTLARPNQLQIILDDTPWLADSRVTAEVVRQALAYAVLDDDLDNRLHAALLARDVATVLAVARLGFAPALDILGKPEGPSTEDAQVVLGKWMVRDPSTLSDAQLAALARALGRLGPAGAETWLLHRVAATSEAVALAALDALGNVGSLASVPALRALRESGRGAIKRAAANALAGVHARLQGTGGELALADTDGGELALHEAEEHTAETSASRQWRKPTVSQ